MSCAYRFRTLLYFGSEERMFYLELKSTLEVILDLPSVRPVAYSGQRVIRRVESVGHLEELDEGWVNPLRDKALEVINGVKLASRPTGMNHVRKYSTIFIIM